MIKKSIQSISPIIKLNEETFADYMIEAQHKDCFDLEFSLSEQKYPVNKLRLMAKSKYFNNLMSSEFSD